MKLCSCGRLATHYVVTFTLDGEPKGKKLMCDSFPKCPTISRPERT
jgi:hypothetical protein